MKKLLNALGYIRESYIEEAAVYTAKKKRSVWLKWGAIAACLGLIVSAIVVPMFIEEGPDIEPYVPNGEPWSPIIHANIESVILSADEVGRVFSATNDYNGTNQYTKIYSSAPEYLNLLPLPNAEYLPIYTEKEAEPSKEALQDFIDRYLNSATAFYGIDTKHYEITKREWWNGTFYYEAQLGNSRKLCFSATGNLLHFDSYSTGDQRLKINGRRISVLESDSDEQIKEKLGETIAYICDTFGKEYTQATIRRRYSYQKLQQLTVYLYTPESTVFPADFSRAPMTSEYIALTFDTEWGVASESNTEAFLQNVGLYETAEEWNEYYHVSSKGKMLTLAEAEKLLEKGYVFGGHSCPLCMAAQPEVDFSQYTCVGIKYVSDINGKMHIPFYAFYKYIGETSDGIGIYATTYVPAIEVGGYQEYFENQRKDHRKPWSFDEVS